MGTRMAHIIGRGCYSDGYMGGLVLSSNYSICIMVESLTFQSFTPHRIRLSLHASTVVCQKRNIIMHTRLIRRWGGLSRRKSASGRVLWGIISRLPQIDDFSSVESRTRLFAYKTQKSLVSSWPRFRCGSANGSGRQAITPLFSDGLKVYFTPTFPFGVAGLPYIGSTHIFYRNR